ncbi:hypothetical protein GGE24_005900 [Bradyrhizobium centrosematis]|nr:hypothetical protein [Bradyrhizobium centrosematis]
MILLEIDPVSVAILEFESDAPGAVHMDSVTDWLSLQTMEVKAEHVHVLGERGAIELIETPQNPGVHLRVDLRRLSFRPEIAKSLVSERLYQESAKSDPATSVSYLLT